MKNFFKKLLPCSFAIITLFVFLQVLPVNANAASASGLTFTLNSDGVSYSVTDCLESASGDLIIPSTYNDKPVTGIGSGAFNNCSSLTGISIPDGVVGIGSGAFNNCSSLTGISIPDGVIDIGSGAFYNCSSLTGVSIPDGVTSISDYAFWGCTSLTVITIPNSVTIVDDCAFRSCTSLTSVDIGNSVTRIGYYAFRGCTSLTSITIPDSITSIEDGAFYNCNLLKDVYFGGTEIQWQQITIGEDNECLTNTNIYFTNAFIASGTCGENLTWTLDNAGTITISGTGPMDDYSDEENELWFPYRDSIKAVMIGEGVTSIGAYAFSGCTALTSVNISDSVVTIGNGAFRCCTGLTTITIPDGVNVIGIVAFEDCTGLTRVSVGNNVTSIRFSAFSGCTALTAVNIPDSVKSIRACAFLRCNNIAYNEYDGLFYLGNTNNPYYALIGVKEIKSQYTIHNNCKVIAGSAFWGRANLNAITIPSGVISVGQWAFQECSSLSSITIPDSVTEIEDSAFYDCSGLKDVYFGGTEAQWQQINIGDDNQCLTKANIHFTNSLIANGTCGENLTWTLDNAGTITISGTGPMSNNSPWSSHRNSIKQVVIENGVTTIGYGAFDGCTNLISVDIPNSITTIGAGAFYNCTNLTSITIPNSVTYIDSSAFGECSKLVYNEYEDILYLGNVENPYHTLIGPKNKGCTQFSIHKNTRIIYSGAFYNCLAVTAITIPDSVIAIASSAFEKCTALTSVTIPDSVATIGDSAFEYCTGLTSVTIGNSVSTIKYWTFRECTSLISITIPTSIIKIEVHAFLNSNNLKTVCYNGSKVDWAKISIEEGNEAIKKADIQYMGEHEHTYTQKVVKPTEKAAGYTKYTCACGHTYKDNYVLLAPTVAIKLDATSGKPVLSWNTIGGASSYYVYRCTTKTGTYTRVATVKKATTWTDISAAVGTKYYYKIKAIGTDRSSGYSNLVAQTPKCAVPTITVTIKSGKPYISWGKVTGAAKYAVYYSTSKTGTYKKLVTTKKTYYAHTGSATGSRCYYKVVAVASNTSYNSGYSGFKSCYVPCAKPVVTVSNDAATGYPVLNWKAVAGAKSYVVYRSTSATKNYKKYTGGKLDTKKRTFTDTAVTAGKTYYYKVVVVGSGNESVYSDYVKATGKCAAPKLTVKLSSKKPSLSWKKVTGAAKYEIQYSTDGKTFKKLTTTTKTSYTYKAKKGTYYYRIKAVGSKSAYNSAYSAVSNAIKVK